MSLQTQCSNWSTQIQQTWLMTFLKNSLGPCCTSQMPWELKGSCLVCCREATAGIPQTRRSTQLHVHIATKTFTTGVLLQKGSKQTACQCKQNLDTHRKHILDMAVATSEGLSVQLRGSVITRSFQKMEAVLTQQVCWPNCAENSCNRPYLCVTIVAFAAAP